MTSVAERTTVQPTSYAAALESAEQLRPASVRKLVLHGLLTSASYLSTLTQPMAKPVDFIALAKLLRRVFEEPIWPTGSPTGKPAKLPRYRALAGGIGRIEMKASETRFLAALSRLQTDAAATRVEHPRRLFDAIDGGVARELVATALELALDRPAGKRHPALPTTDATVFTNMLAQVFAPVSVLQHLAAGKRVARWI